MELIIDQFSLIVSVHKTDKFVLYFIEIVSNILIRYMGS